MGDIFICDFMSCNGILFGVNNLVDGAREPRTGDFAIVFQDARAVNLFGDVCQMEISAEGADKLHRFIDADVGQDFFAAALANCFADCFNENEQGRSFLANKGLPEKITEFAHICT